MYYAEQFITESKREKNELQMINIVQNHKRIYLPVKFIRMRGVSQTNTYNDIRERSMIK